MRWEGLRKKAIRSSYFNWLRYVMTFVILQALAAIPPLMFGGFGMLSSAKNRPYLRWYILYWIAVTAVFCSLAAFQKYIAFDKPMNQFGEATRKVAKGDFSVSLSQVHKFGKTDYVDAMFLDFNKMVEELRSIETLKNNFIADVSHEIKTPLAVIQNYITMMQEDDLPAMKKAEYMDIIFASSEKLTKLITNILKLNKLENQKIIPMADAYNLCGQLSECVFGFEELLETKNLRFEAELEERVLIEADKSLLELVWNNLLSNAIKFTEPGGFVSLRQYSEEDRVIVTVSDSGCGMDEKTQKHIFEKFYQGDTSRSVEGNGLGLALVKKVIELAGGRIHVKSRPGTGTTFGVELPRKQGTLCTRLYETVYQEQRF